MQQYKRRTPLRGYRGQRGSGCLSVVVWLGILVNVGFIAMTINSGGGLAGLLPTTTNAAASLQRALTLGDFSAALPHARTLYEQNRTDPAALVSLVRALVYHSYTDFAAESARQEALTLAQAAANSTPNNADILAALAFAQQANGQAGAAAQTAQRALALDEAHTLARTALAFAYARAGSFDVAQRESMAVLAQEPNMFDARRAYAISTADLGNYSEAGALFDALIADHRAAVPLYFERALYAMQLSDSSTAEQAYLTVLRIQTDNVKARLRLCELTSNIGERDSALTYCTQVTERAPTLPEGWYRLGRLKFLQGDFTLAQSTLNRCTTLQVLQNVPPQSRIFECWYLQGQAAEILGDCPALLSTYNQFQIMATDASIRQTWTYPPEGPPICQ